MENEAQAPRPFPQTGTHPDSREQGVELGIFLFLIVPSMVFSFLAIKQGAVGFGITAVATMLRDLALVSLVLFFLWRNGEALTSLGWRPRWGDIAIGIVLFVPFFFFTDWLSGVLESAGLSSPSTPLPAFLAAKGISQFLLALLLVVVVAIAEETIFRGYLILRFEGISRSPVLAVLASAFVFSLGHGYEGAAGVVTVGVMGIVFALVYIWRRSLVAPMTMHFLQDFLAIVLLPYLGLR